MIRCSRHFHFSSPRMRGATGDGRWVTRQRSPPLVAHGAYRLKSARREKMYNGYRYLIRDILMITSLARVDRRVNAAHGEKLTLRHIGFISEMPERHWYDTYSDAGTPRKNTALPGMSRYTLEMRQDMRGRRRAFNRQILLITESAFRLFSNWRITYIRSFCIDDE